MAKFIKLTTMDGDEIRVNMEAIESYRTITHAEDERFIGMTVMVSIGDHGSDEPYVVRESPRKIDALMQKKHFCIGGKKV